MKHTFVWLLAILFLFSIASAETVRLTVAGNDIPVELFDAYAREHPEVEIAILQDSSIENLILTAQLREDGTDLYFLNTVIDQTYNNLRDRGFFAQINAPELQPYIDGLYPEILQGLQHNGGICAIPCASIVQNTIFVDIKTWHDLGLEEEDLPKTWQQWLDFLIQDWPAISEANPSVFPFQQDESQRILQMIQENYYNLQYWNGGVDFDTRTFHEIVERFAQVDWASMYPQREHQRGTRFLFLQSSLTPMNLSVDYVFLPLAFEDGGTAIVPISVTAMAVNPDSKHGAEAHDLMRYILQNLDALDRIELYTDARDPIPNPEAETDLAEIERTMARYAQQIEEESDSSARAALEVERDAYYEDALQTYHRTQYLASPESIESFKSCVEGRYLFMADSSISMAEYEAVREKREQFIAGNIDADQFIHELQRRYVFSLREDS